jgi:sulfite exporter TauE/SafE
MSLPLSLYGALLVSGFLGSLGHCLGMCGPLVLMLGARLKTQNLPLFPAQLLYHGARIGTYAVLGAVVGGLGSLFGVGAMLNRAAGMISLVLGLGVVLFGLGYLGWLPLGKLEGAGAWWNRAMGRALKAGGLTQLALLGALNGVLPCGLVYSALLVAASTGGIVQGALGMAIFGAGTLPALLVVGIGAGTLSARTRQTLTRVAGVLIVLVGVQLALRGASALGFIPPLRIGGFVLW